MCVSIKPQATRVRHCPGPETKSWVSAAEIEDAAMRHMFETFGNPTAVRRAMEEATPNNERIQEALKRLEFVTTELSKIENSRQRVLDLVVKGTISETSSNTQLQKLKEREQKLKEEHARLGDELEHIPSG